MEEWTNDDWQTPTEIASLMGQLVHCLGYRFGLSAFGMIATNLSRNQAQDLLKESYRQKFIKEILKSKLLKHQWAGE